MTPATILTSSLAGRLSGWKLVGLLCASPYAEKNQAQKALSP